MDESKPLEEIKTWEHPPRFGIDKFKERVILTFSENQEGLFHNLMTHFQMPVKLWTISGPCREASFNAITLNQESNFTRREKNHSLFRWNTLTYPELLIRIWMSSRRNASMIIGISMGLETCHCRIYVVRVETDQKAVNIQARSFLARTLGENGKECQAEWEAKVVTWKTSTRWCAKIARNSFQLTPRTRNSRWPSRMLARNWKHQWLPQCLTRSARTIRVVGVVINNVKSKLACIWKPMNPPECIRKKGNNSLQHYNLVHKIGSSGQGMGKIGEIFGVEPDESQKKERGDRGSGDERLRLTDGHMSFEKCWIGGKAPKIQRSSCTPRWYCERRFWVLCSIHWTRIFSITNDSS